MKGDFARVSFDPARHYSQVMQQQGRIMLEADLNEQSQIQLYLLRIMMADLVGPFWASGSGFMITKSGKDKDWQLAPGHCYVDGILCQNEAMCALSSQPNAPTPEDVRGNWTNLTNSHALWLDVWERHISAIESPEIADPALNGVDTASRVQTVWQVRPLVLDSKRLIAILKEVEAALGVRLQALKDSKSTYYAAIKSQLEEVVQLRNNITQVMKVAKDELCTWLCRVLGARASYAWPRLSADLGPVASDNDPCVIAAEARYRGCENQLYRVEIHQGDAAGGPNAASTPNFKWSRENGSLIFPILSTDITSSTDGSSQQLKVSLASLGRDRRTGLAVNDWVELVDDKYSLAQLAKPLLQVMAVDATQRMVTLAIPENVTPYEISDDPTKHPLLRRWDQSEKVDSQGCVPVIEGQTIELEDGVQITFQPGGIYSNGDYWLIPARVAGNGTLDWPRAPDGTPVALQSSGMHHSAVLGIVGTKGEYSECCCRFDSLCALISDMKTRRLAPATRRVAKKATTKVAKKKGRR